MKGKIFLLVALFLISAGVTIFLIAPNISKDNKATTTEQETPVEKVEPPKPKIDPVKEQLESMTLDEKIAQLLIVQNPGMTISEAELRRLETKPYGGYILMENNYGTLAETRKFVQTLQDKSKHPLIIATDQEGGLVQRLTKITDRVPTNIPDMYRLGKTNDDVLAKEVGRVMAEEMRVIGINVDFAPDADVFLNPQNQVIGTRSFSEKPEVVAKMSLALTQGMEENGVVATYKHFPGHGDTATDSHLNLPIINRTREDLDKVDLVPFKNAIDNGAKVIMSGHIALPKVTGNNDPATLSKQILTDLLRDELGYTGLIVTDGMNMGALVNNYPEDEIYYRAIAAGADMLVLPAHPDLAIKSIKDNISEERIDESVYRIMKFKSEELSDYKMLDEKYFGNEDHTSVIKRIP